MKRLLGIAVAIGWVSVLSTVCAQTGTNLRRDAEQIQKLNYFYRFLIGNYVDDIAVDEVVERSIINTLSELDPHSVYLTAEEMASVRESMSGVFGGIGVEYAVYRDTVIVVNTVAGSPASKAGMMPDDRIVAVDGESIIGISRADVPGLLRGECGSTLRLDVMRKGVLLPALELKRDNIPLPAISASYVDESVGYVRVGRFSHTTAMEFAHAIAEMGTIKGLILDLRGNGGGVMEAAVSMTEMFLQAGNVIVSTSGHAGAEKHYAASSTGALSSVPLAVLIDEESASASEIVAGALQDWDRAVVIGRQSFGKGLVQRQVEFGDGSAMRLTVARYKTPSGRIIQRPYRNGHSSEYYRSHLERYMGAADSVQTNDSLLFHTLRSGRKVYGGGGITPDVIIKADTAFWPKCLRQLAASETIADYVLSYVVSHRGELLERYPTLDEYDAAFSLSDADLADIAYLARERGAEIDDAEYDASKTTVDLYVKALIAERIYPHGAFFYICNRRRDKAYAQALDIVNRWEEAGRTILQTE
ncbi:MAG: PDZ domain-containing protein [Alistipes sp.]|nr:PDZ domain-containing protein [Alistipes sp.]